MESTLRKEQKIEAINRMKIIGIMPRITKEFQQSNIVNYSENSYLYWVKNHPEYVNIIKKFEEETNGLVYHCELTHLKYNCDHLSLLYVSEYKEEWSADREDLKNNMPYAQVYVINLDDNNKYIGIDEFCSELGTIGIKLCPSGGILRTY